ncbi:MAG: hypothetical protein DRP37_02470 [Thermodesulfobacteriota bacterium]|nr:MAG: hypothetical protein DRP37_02470 [Thermodesulfobacteriota bacterium]
MEKNPRTGSHSVTEDGQKHVLESQARNKELASSGREFLKDLKKRGLDGLPSLEKVFKDKFPEAKGYQCQGTPGTQCFCEGTKKIEENSGR